MLFMSHELHSIVRCASSCLDIGALHTTVQAFETATINDLSSLKILSCMRLHDIYLMHSFLLPPPHHQKKVKHTATNDENQTEILLELPEVLPSATLSIPLTVFVPAACVITNGIDPLNEVPIVLALRVFNTCVHRFM